MRKKLLLPFTHWRKAQRVLLLLLCAAFTLPSIAETLTVYDGTTTNDRVPAYIFYWDDFSRSQYVIPATDLEDMAGGTISAIKFYTNSTNVPYTSTSTADVYLKEVSNTAISSYETKASCTTVYQGTVQIISANGGGEMTITFTQPFKYNGGNLLIGIDNTTDAGYKHIYFYGQAVSGASIAGSNGSSTGTIPATQQNFIPKTTFTYTPGSSCARPTNLAASNVVYNGATLTWTPGDAEQDAWQVVYGTGNFDPSTATPIDVTGNATYTITGLTENTTYTAYVRGNCGNNVSVWSQVCTFTTPERYAKPTDLAVSNVTHNSATATWTGNNDAQSYNLRYRKRVPSWNFEDAAQFNEFIIVDNDGDNYNWKYYNNAGLTQGIMAAHGGDGLIISESYDNDAGLALSPDNWLISQVIDLGGTLTFWAAGQDSDYPEEKFGLFVCTSNSTNPADFTQVDTDKTATDTYTKYSFDLSQYAGQTGRFAIVHHNVSDMFILKVDDIEITGMSDSEWTIVNSLTASQYNIEGLAHSIQYEVQVQAVYADGTSDWTNSVNFTTLAVPYVYPPVNLEAEGNASGAIEMNWEMPVICTEDFDDTVTFPEFSLGGITSTEHSGTIGNWTLYDANEGAATYSIQNNTVPNLGSPMGWIVYALGYVNYPTHSGNQFMASFCVTSGATDHWLISPLLNGEEQTISFFARELTTQYGDETFEVLASSTDNSPASFTNVVSLSSSSTDWTEFTASLPAGTKYFAIRHTSNDIFALFVDDVTFIPAVSTLPTPDSFNIYLDGELVGSVNGDVMSYTIQNVAPGEYVCSVTAVYDDLESDPATATAIVPVPQSMTLAELVANGEVGIRYTISESLLAVYGVGNKLWLKDDNKYATKATPAEGDQNYEIILQGNPHENQADYDQSNWIEVQLADGSEAVENLVGTRITADKITGTFSNKTNPTMTGVTLVEGDYGITAGEDEYMLNYYCTANFVGPQNGTIAGETYHFFFMTPKPQECAKVVWAKYDANNGKMIMPSEGNGHGFHGEFEVDLSLNSGTPPKDGKTYNFEAIVRMIEPTGGNTLRDNNSNGYIVYPLNLSDAVVTGINDVTGKAVAGVKYYNVAGIESDRPFEGVNIIVTTYTDGSRSSAKVLK